MARLCRDVFIALMSVFALGHAAMAAASALPAPLENALLDAEARSKDNAGIRFYFQRTLVRFGEKFLERSYNPAGEVGQQWAILYPTPEIDDREYKKQVRKHAKKTDGTDQRLIMEPLRARLSKGVTLLRETETEIVYGFEIGDEYYVSGEGKGADIAQYLDGQIAVDKKTGMIAWVHYTSPEAFRPIFIAKVRVFDIYQEFAPAWYGGPMVKVLEKNLVGGTALIRKIEFDDVVTNYDFRPIAGHYPVYTNADNEKDSES